MYNAQGLWWSINTYNEKETFVFCFKTMLFQCYYFWIMRLNPLTHELICAGKLHSCKNRRNIMLQESHVPSMCIYIWFNIIPYERVCKLVKIAQCSKNMMMCLVPYQCFFQRFMMNSFAYTALCPNFLGYFPNLDILDLKH